MRAMGAVYGCFTCLRQAVRVRNVGVTRAMDAVQTISPSATQGRPSPGRVVMGPFEVDPGGALFPRDGNMPPRFSFTWRTIVIEARLASDRLRLVASIGRVPSSALNLPRAPVFALLQGLASLLPPGWKLSLSSSHLIRFDAEMRMAQPLTATDLVTALTCYVQALMPYWDTVNEVCANGPGAIGSRLSRIREVDAAPQ